MARRTRDRQDRLGQLLTQVERRFQDSPLSEVGELLAGTISALQASAQAGLTDAGAVESLAGCVTVILDSLPSSFGDRFDFDALLVRALAGEWSQGGARLSGMLVPKPSDIWGHQRVPMPSFDRKPLPVIDVLHVPGEDNLDDLDLLTYPFMCHELGHNLLFKQGDEFCASFTRTLDRVVNGLQRQTLALQGPGRQIADSTTEQIRRYWTPTANHYNWAHEIAVDVIALWTCGSAYLAALHDVMDEGNLNPYQLGQSHPPYEVRARAMIEVATQLGWAYYTGDFQDLIDRWPTTVWAQDKTNLYAACADTRLVQGSVSAALETCRSFSAPALHACPRRGGAGEAAPAGAPGSRCRDHSRSLAHPHSNRPAQLCGVGARRCPPPSHRPHTVMPLILYERDTCKAPASATWSTQGRLIPMSGFVKHISASQTRS